MIYVFDTSSFSNLEFYYPTIFPSIWDNLNVLVEDGSIISTREVWNELQNGKASSSCKRLAKGIL